MEAGLTDHVWSLVELVGLLDQKAQGVAACRAKEAERASTRIGSNSHALPLPIQSWKSDGPLLFAEVAARTLANARIHDLGKIENSPLPDSQLPGWLD
jgi:hypothetical protein